MILSILKLVVALVVGVFTVVAFCAKLVWNVISDGAAQAKEATPGVVSALKVEASATADKAKAKAPQIEADLRKLVKVPAREKQTPVQKAAAMN